MTRRGSQEVERRFRDSEKSFARWEVVKDLIDEMIDIPLNYRQSGHPGGSRSKVHALVATLLSGAMRWDILRPWRRFSDRFVLSAGHTVPLVYATLAVLNESLRLRSQRTPDAFFAFPDDGKHALTWEDLLTLRRRGRRAPPPLFPGSRVMPFQRSAGRPADALRPVTLQRGYTRHAEGSVLVSFGDTRVLCTASVEEKVPPHKRGSGQGWVTGEYGMLPRSTHTRSDRALDGPGAGGARGRGAASPGALLAGLRVDAGGPRLHWMGRPTSLQLVVAQQSPISRIQRVFSLSA